MKGRGPNIRTPDNNGYYKATIRSNTKIYTCSEINDQKTYGLSKTSKFRLCPCYTDINDKDTLQWWFIYKKSSKKEQPLKLEVII